MRVRKWQVELAQAAADRTLRAMRRAQDRYDRAVNHWRQLNDAWQRTRRCTRKV